MNNDDIFSNAVPLRFFRGERVPKIIKGEEWEYKTIHTKSPLVYDEVDFFRFAIAWDNMRLMDLCDLTRPAAQMCVRLSLTDAYLKIKGANFYAHPN